MIDLIVPRPIAFVSTIDAAGRRNLAPFSYFMGVAAEPPLLAISVSRRAGAAKDTARNILDGGEFVVNAATQTMAPAVVAASGDWDPDIDEFAHTGLTPLASHVVRAPRVAESPFALECRLHHAVELGSAPRSTHLLVGEIVWIHVADAVLSSVDPQAPEVDPGRLAPLARLGRNLYTGLGPIFSLDRPRGSRPGSG